MTSIDKNTPFFTANDIARAMRIIRFYHKKDALLDPNDQYSKAINDVEAKLISYTKNHNKIMEILNRADAIISEAGFEDNNMIKMVFITSRNDKAPITEEEQVLIDDYYQLYYMETRISYIIDPNYKIDEIPRNS